MSEHRINLEWSRATPDFEYKTYNRDHHVRFKSGETIGMSAAVAYKGNPDLIDPEEAFVASLSSCHMLTFLAIACRRGLIVDRYTDDAVGHLEKNEQGKLAITQVTLRPMIEFAAGHKPDEQMLERLHHEAHEQCFIANSVKTQVTVEAGARAR